MAYIEWTDEQLKVAGIPKLKLEVLISKLRECSELMQEMGFQVYGESGDGYLIHKSRPEHDDNGKADMGAIVASVGYGFDGGGW